MKVTRSSFLKSLLLVPFFSRLLQPSSAAPLEDRLALFKKYPLLHKLHPDYRVPAATEFALGFNFELLDPLVITSGSGEKLGTIPIWRKISWSGKGPITNTDVPQYVAHRLVRVKKKQLSNVI
jgi:hypothetical protein